jgi:PAS domain S-box-containing protein
MSNNALNIKKETDSNLVLDNIILREFQNTLTFISETCDFTDAFIAVKNGDRYKIQTKIGLSSLLEPSDLNHFLSFSQRNEEMIICDSENSSNTPLFFAGFPIVVPHFFVGCICLSANNPKELSIIELKIIKQSVSKLESLLQLEQIKQQHRQKFRAYEENSTEVLSQISLEGLFTYASTNSKTFIGYEPNDIIGKHYVNFIHPDDIKNYSNNLNSIALNNKNITNCSYRFLHKEGYYVWRSSRVQFYKQDEKLFYISNCIDITNFVESKQQLKEHKDFYETIFNSIPYDVVAFDINHKYLLLNPAAIKNDELRAFIVGKDDFEYALFKGRDPGFAIDRRKNFKTALKTRKSYSWEETLVINDITTFHKRTFTPVYNIDGSFKVMIGFSVELTESKKAEQALYESKKLLENVLNNTAAGILVQGPQSEILEMNAAACKMLGLTENQLKGRTSYDPAWEIIREDRSPFETELLPVPTTLRTLKPVYNVTLGVRRPIKQDLIWLLVNSIPVFGKNKELLYVVASFSNITSQKKAEQSIKINNERFKYINEASIDVIWDADLLNSQVIIGSGYTKQFGHKLSTKTGLKSAEEWFNLVHPEDQIKVSNNRQKSIDNPRKNKWNIEYRFKKTNGDYANIREKVYLVRDKTGKAIRLIGAMSDITLERKLTDELRESEEKFKGAFEYSSVGIGLVDKNGFWIDSNKKLCSILGYSRTELQSLTFMDLTHPDDLERDAVHHTTLKKNKKSFFQMEKRYIHKNKKIIWVNLHASSVKDREGNILYYLGQIIDITEKKRIEEQNALLLEENNLNKALQLNEAKNLYRLLADNTVDLVCLHSLDGTFEYVSPSVKQLLGFEQEDLIGVYPLDFAHPDDLARLQNSILEFRNGAQDMAVQGRFKTASGSYIWLETIPIVVKENGVPVRIQTSTRDITLRKEAEETIKSNLVNEIKLNELRTNLVSTISHEFRTPMTTIRASTELIEMYLEGQKIEHATKINKHTSTITTEIDRIIDLMNAVLTISKEDSGKTKFKPISFDLKTMCTTLIEKYYNDNNDSRKVITTIANDTFPLFADKHLMEYTILNVLSNAFKYSPEATDVYLNLFYKEGKIQVEIIDLGIGIPEKDQVNLFNTFYRASNTNGTQGTGLGLYIVKTFTEKNGGSVSLESALGKGTKVILTFPRFE